MRTKRILLIDDEKDIQSLIQLSLELETDWEVIIATSGREGLVLAEAQQPDAILLDVMMPEMDGLSTLAKIKTNPKLEHIPIIFLTAKAQISDRKTFYAAGVDGVITKPFDTLTLASQISGFLGW
jgi:CheY-like chemotaxis protein